MGHQHDRRGGARPESQQLEVEPLPAERVEGAEGLVQQQDVGLEGEGAGERDPLARATRQLGRAVADDPGIDRDEVEQLREPCRAAIRRPAGKLQRVRDVGRRRSPGEESWFLEHEADARVGAADRLAVERDRPRPGPQQTGDDAQEGRLAAPVGPDERDDPATRHVQVEAVEDPQRGGVVIARRERQVDAGDVDRAATGRGHAGLPAIDRSSSSSGAMTGRIAG